MENYQNFQEGFSTKEYCFSDSTNSCSLSVTIPEVPRPDFGFYTWPCASVLAHFVWQQRGRIRNKTIIEIGAGTALPGIVASKCEARVIVSDKVSPHNPASISQKSLELNQVTDVPVVGITWGLVTSALVALPDLDFILMSDCWYDSKDFEDTIMTLAFLLRKNPCAEAWCTYEERSVDRTLEHLLHKWQLEGHEEEVKGDPPVPTGHVIRLCIIRLQKKS